MLISISSRVLVCVLLFVVGCVGAVEIDEEKVVEFMNSCSNLVFFFFFFFFFF